ncbi:MAG: hypothetical protein HQL12_09480 [Candidatus Omnitrophica bacterium]|nr:hypothetical protein [Candidatus Omnitrophota bacterium]
MKKIISYTGNIFLFITFIGISSIATASISNNNIGSIAEASNSNSSSILSDNAGSIGAASNSNIKPNANNTTQTNTDTTGDVGNGIFNRNLEETESNSELPDNAAQ